MSAGVVFSALDITARREAAQALQRSEARFRSVLENTNLIGMMLDREGRLIFANDTLLELVGWQREEALGQVWFDTFLPPEEKATTGDYLASGSVRANPPVIMRTR